MVGDDLDVRAVHATHAEFAWASLQRLGVRPSDLEDMLQEVFVVVHRRLHTYDRTASLTSWIYSICVKVAAGYRRKAHRRRELPVEVIPERGSLATSDERLPSPEHAASEEQARLQLYALLDEMDLDKRAVFVMYEIEEMSCEQIAARIEIPVGTVYSRLHAARRAFDGALARLRARQSREGCS